MGSGAGPTTRLTRDPDFPNQVRRALRKALRRDQFAKLKDAGSVADAQSRIGQVFVDLPVNLGNSHRNRPDASPFAADMLDLEPSAKGQVDVQSGGGDGH